MRVQFNIQSVSEELLLALYCTNVGIQLMLTHSRSLSFGYLVGEHEFCSDIGTLKGKHQLSLHDHTVL